MFYYIWNKTFLFSSDDTNIIAVDINDETIAIELLNLLNVFYTNFSFYIPRQPAIYIESYENFYEYIGPHIYNNENGYFYKIVSLVSEKTMFEYLLPSWKEIFKEDRHIEILEEINNNYHHWRKEAIIRSII